MTTKPRKEAEEAVRQLQQGMDLTRLRMRPEGAARLVEQVAIRTVADPLAGELEWYEERARQLADPKRPDNYKEAVFKELELDGGRRARDALAAYRGEGK